MSSNRNSDFKNFDILLSAVVFLESSSIDLNKCFRSFRGDVVTSNTLSLEPNTSTRIKVLMYLKI